MTDKTIKEDPPEEENSYGQILTSSSIMGGVAVVTLILGMIRNKFAAVLIGTTGVGLSASFTAIQGFIGAIAGLGIQSSAVREVAAAYAKGDDRVVGETVLTLRRVCWITALLGALSMMLLSPVLSQLTFSSNEYQWDIAALGLIIFFANVSGGQTALLQGARRIADMARAQVVGAVAGTVITVGFYFWLGLRGIIPALVLMAAVQLVISWHFAKRLPVPKVQMTWRQSFYKAGDMVKLGLVMMWTGLMGAGVTYATTALIAQEINVQAVGIYSAAFALSGMFVNFVLSAMSADYYPRLTAAAGDHAKVNRLVNEQTEIGLLLAVPSLLATMVLAPWIVQIFYAKEFLPAVQLIQWFILGCLGRVISWPLGFVMLALGKGRWFLFTETLGHLAHLLVAMLCLNLSGLIGVAQAFFLIYVGYFFVVFGVAKKLTNFSWGRPSFRITSLALISIFLSLGANSILESWAAMVVSATLLVIISLMSLRGLTKRLGSNHRLTRLFVRLPILGSVARI